MRVPNLLLRESLSVENHNANGARGASYGAARTIRGSVQQTSRLIRDSRGVEVMVDALAIIRPEAAPLPVESRITWAGQVYRVVSSFPMPDSRRPSHWELGLVRWAG